MIQIEIPGIRIKPYVRMTRRGKFVSKQAQEYLASKANLSAQLKQYMTIFNKKMFPPQMPLKVVIRLYASTNPGHKCDLDNQVKAILDSCNKIVFPDDRWVDQIDAQRFIGPYEQLLLIVFALRK